MSDLTQFLIAVLSNSLHSGSLWCMIISVKWGSFKGRSVINSFALCNPPLQLYDLMTMAFKYQVLLCPRPKDILLVTFNHMDAIKDFVRDTPSIHSQVDETYRQLIEVQHLSVIIVSLSYFHDFFRGYFDPFKPTKNLVI